MRDLQNFILNRKFDIIICIGNSFALFPLEERLNIVNQAIAALKPGSKLILQVVNYLKHKEETEWTINPSVFRNENGLLSFFVRILEWSDEKKEKVNMYVQRLFQDVENPKEFIQDQKGTEFHVVKKSDFNHLEVMEKVKIRYLGDYTWNEYIEEKSNDLIVIIEKN